MLLHDYCGNANRKLPLQSCLPLSCIAECHWYNDDTATFHREWLAPFSLPSFYVQVCFTVHCKNGFEIVNLCISNPILKIINSCAKGHLVLLYKVDNEVDVGNKA